MIDLRLGDCLQVMKTLPDNSVDAIVTDPPAGISFMGKAWDDDKGGRDNWIKWMQEIASECFRLIKPGGHALVWAIPRTTHWTATAWENAGFEPRDVIAHVFGSGFPKSLNIGKAVDKLQGNEREIVGKKGLHKFNTTRADKNHGKYGKDNRTFEEADQLTRGNSEWEGWGTALKPAREDWWLLRKPLSEKNVAENVLRWNTGGINIDDTRVKSEYQLQGNDLSDIIKICQLNHLNLPVNNAELKRFQDDMTNAIKMLCSALVSANTLTLEKTLGRLQEDITIMDMLCCEGMLVENMNTSLNIFTSGKKSSDLYLKVAKYTILTVKKMITDWKISNSLVSQLTESLLTQVKNLENTSDVQGRFPSNLIHDGSDEVVGLFPKSKSTPFNSKKPNNPETSWKMTSQDYAPQGGFSDSGSAARFFYCAKASKSERQGSTHPTMKPIRLMEYLVKLVSREGATVLDPFMGSGSTGIACRNLKRNFIGIELDPEYLKIAKARINSAHQDNLV